MSDRHLLIAYLSTLGAICVLFSIACLLLYVGKSVEAIGVGGVMTGLIGILGTFKPQQRKVEVEQPPGKPVPTAEEQP